MTTEDAQLLHSTIERLRFETGLSSHTVHELMEAVAALLLHRASDSEFAEQSSITVTADGLRTELLDLGVPSEQATRVNVEKILDSLLAMAR
jgi:phenylalanyl-tRNA synthetase beta subunit